MAGLDPDLSHGRAASAMSRRQESSGPVFDHRKSGRKRSSGDARRRVRCQRRKIGSGAEERAIRIIYIMERTRSTSGRSQAPGHTLVSLLRVGSAQPAGFSAVRSDLRRSTFRSRHRRNGRSAAEPPEGELQLGQGRPGLRGFDPARHALPRAHASGAARCRRPSDFDAVHRSLRGAPVVRRTPASEDQNPRLDGSHALIGYRFSAPLPIRRQCQP